MDVIQTPIAIIEGETKVSEDELEIITIYGRGIRKGSVSGLWSETDECLEVSLPITDSRVTLSPSLLQVVLEGKDADVPVPWALEGLRYAGRDKPFSHRTYMFEQDRLQVDYHLGDFEAELGKEVER